MKRSGGPGRVDGEGCRCLPDVLPEEVRRSLDELGGLEALSERVPGTEELAEAVSRFKAMADGLRLQILNMLAVSPLCVCVIRAVTGVEDSKLSYHLGVLRSAGLIDAEKRGSWIIYSITEHGARLFSTCTTQVRDGSAVPPAPR